MFPKLEKKFVILYTLSTGLILTVILTAAFMFFLSSQNSRRKSIFQDQLFTLMSRLQTDSVFSDSYLAQLEQKHQLAIYIEENILCPSYINGKQHDKEYYQFLIKVLGIENLIKKMPYELSGGEQQRVAIARAMLLKPKIIFADEPTGNLDTGNTEIITGLFEKLNKEYNTTFIIVTHEENLIEHCGQVIRLKDGEAAIG